MAFCDKYKRDYALCLTNAVNFFVASICTMNFLCAFTHMQTQVLKIKEVVFV